MFQIYEEAIHLPAPWYHLTHEKPWMHPKKLSLLEKLQPCRQDYHLDPEAGIAFVSYTLRLNALALTRDWQVKFPVRIVGLPLSLAECAYDAHTEKARKIMTNHIRSQKGLWVILNAAEEFPLPGGATLPSCRLPLIWNTFDEYLASLRSPYRRWVRKGLEKGSSLRVQPLAQEEFSEAHYGFYEEVHRHSPYQLEKLGFSFFQQFPANLYEFSLNDQPVGFVQLSMNHPVLTFMFCGFDRSLVASHHLYLYMLLWMLQLGIEHKYALIDFGQTTEETKTKLGAVIHPKKMYLSHSNPVFYSLLKPLSRLLSYPGYPVTHHVFKESF